MLQYFCNLTLQKSSAYKYFVNNINYFQGKLKNAQLFLFVRSLRILKILMVINFQIKFYFDLQVVLTYILQFEIKQ